MEPKEIIEYIDSRLKENVIPFDVERDAIQLIEEYAQDFHESRIWISIKDKMPKRGVTVIGFFPNGDEGGKKVATAISYNGETLISDFPNSTAHCFEATLWMYMPELPIFS